MCNGDRLPRHVIQMVKQFADSIQPTYTKVNFLTTNSKFIQNSVVQGPSQPSVNLCPRNLALILLITKAWETSVHSTIVAKIIWINLNGRGLIIMPVHICWLCVLVWIKGVVIFIMSLYLPLFISPSTSLHPAQWHYVSATSIKSWVTWRPGTITVPGVYKPPRAYYAD